MSQALQSFRRALQNISSDSETELFHSQLAGVLTQALNDAVDEETATTIAQESSLVMPLPQVLEIAIPCTGKIPDYVIDVIFFDLVATTDLDAVAKSLRLIAAHRYPLLEQIALKEDVLFHLRRVFDELLLYPGHA